MAGNIPSQAYSEPQFYQSLNGGANQAKVQPLVAAPIVYPTGVAVMAPVAGSGVDNASTLNQPSGQPQKSISEAVAESTQHLFDKGAEAVTELGNQFSSIEHGISKIPERTIRLGKEVVELGENVAAEAIGTGMEYKAAAAGLATSAGAVVANAVSTATTTSTSLLGWATRGVFGLLHEVIEEMTNATNVAMEGKARNIPGEIQDTALETTVAVANKAQDLVGSLQETAKQIPDRAHQTFLNLPDKISQAGQSAYEVARNVADTAIHVTDKGLGLGMSAVDSAESVAEKVVDVGKNVANSILPSLKSEEKGGISRGTGGSQLPQTHLLPEQQFVYQTAVPPQQQAYVQPGQTQIMYQSAGSVPTATTATSAVPLPMPVTYVVSGGQQQIPGTQVANLSPVVKPLQQQPSVVYRREE